MTEKTVSNSECWEQMKGTNYGDCAEAYIIIRDNTSSSSSSTCPYGTPAGHRSMNSSDRWSARIASNGTPINIPVSVPPLKHHFPLSLNMGATVNKLLLLPYTFELFLLFFPYALFFFLFFGFFLKFGTVRAAIPFFFLFPHNYTSYCEICHCLKSQESQ